MIAIPEAFARGTVDREGAAGAAWLSELPGIVGELLRCWECVLDGEVLHGGVAVVVPVRRRAGDDAVLKVSYPHPGNAHEPNALVAWQGRGAVVLHRQDAERFAMLLERVRPASLAEIEDGDEVVRIAGLVNRRLAVAAPPGLPRLCAEADAWQTQLREDGATLAQVLPRRVLEVASATVRELGRAQPDTMIHGDFHARNILRAGREPWLAVDPKGYVGDPAYDGGTLLKSRAVALLDEDDLVRAVSRVLDVFAETAELDRERVQRWAQLQAVQAASSGYRHGFRAARRGPQRDRLVRFACRLAELLTECSVRSL